MRQLGIGTFHPNEQENTVDRCNSFTTMCRIAVEKTKLSLLLIGVFIELDAHNNT